MNPLAGPMTQQRSRELGGLLIAIAAAIKLTWFLGSFGGQRSVLASIVLGIIVVPIAALLFWIGVTLVVMNWDNPADYPPADPAPLDD